MPYFNQLDLINNIPNQIALKLFENDNLFKLLKYDSPDALNRPITIEDKILLMNQDGSFEDIKENTRIWYDPFPINDQTIEDQRTELRIYEQEFIPDNNVLTKAIISFEIIVSNKLSRLDDGARRRNRVLQEIIQTLNGKQVGGIGLLFFDSRNSFCRMRYFTNTFTGFHLTMMTRTV